MPRRPLTDLFANQHLRRSVRLAYSLAIPLFPEIRSDGISIRFTDLYADRAECAIQLRRTLRLIADTGGRYPKLAERIRTVVVWPGGWTFPSPPSAIHVGTKAFELGDLALASLIVHDATHLRLAAAGIRYDVALRERIEQICVREAATFLRSQPEPDEEMAQAFETSLASKWWTPENERTTVLGFIDRGEWPRWLRWLAPR